MQTLEISTVNALQAYNAADTNGKKLLELLLGKQNFLKITDRVKTFEEACAITGDSTTLPYPNPQTCDEMADNFMRQMRIIARALNPVGWQLDYKDGNQKKWYPWMQYDASVSAFRFDDSFYYTGASAGSGVRLFSKELSDYFGTQFTTLISNYLLTQQ